MAGPLSSSAPITTSDINRSSNHEPSEKKEDVIGVFLVDGHPAIRKVLSAAVNETAGMTVVGTRSNGNDALPKIQKYSPDVVVAEISLGGVDGLTLTRQIRSQTPDTRILVYSRYKKSVYAEWAIRAGASGYVRKTKPTQEVLRAIEGVHDGQIYLRPDTRSHILDKLIQREDTSADSGLEALNLREITVLQMIGDGNSVVEIADHLNLNRKTVEAYRRRVKEKMGCDSIDELLQHAVLWTTERSWD